MGKDFNHSAALLCCVVVWTMCAAARSIQQLGFLSRAVVAWGVAIDAETNIGLCACVFE